MWARALLEELHIKLATSTVLYVDNAAAEQLIKNVVFYRKTRHIPVKYHYTRDIVKQKKMIIEHITSKEQLADFLTKPLTAENFKRNREGLNICSKFSASGSVELGGVRAIT